ncbi:MAG: nuclear transport factor 2 family protein [Candidatus Thorarchaeota archaeon]|nr:nuclear transport factor 2 family protein [Candidatus Thorarchaeota archaeon]
MLASRYKDLFRFAKDWLDAWTGNDPEFLLSFYTDDALYVDPANRNGLRGKDEIRSYFVRLLDVYRDWTWVPLEVFPIEKGMIVKWRCQIHIPEIETIEETGVDIVEIRDGKISRNEVYFDRSRLVEVVQARRRMHRLIS